MLKKSNSGFFLQIINVSRKLEFARQFVNFPEKYHRAGLSWVESACQQSSSWRETVILGGEEFSGKIPFLRGELCAGEYIEDKFQIAGNVLTFHEKPHLFKRRTMQLV